MLSRILQASGNDIDRLKAVASELPAPVASQLEQLTSLAEQIIALDDDISVTLDPLDRQGDGYHSSIGFAVYSEGSRGAIAAGGAYVTPYQEPAIGLSIYMERVQRILPCPSYSGAVIYCRQCRFGHRAEIYQNRQTYHYMGKPWCQPR